MTLQFSPNFLLTFQIYLLYCKKSFKLMVKVYYSSQRVDKLLKMFEKKRPESTLAIGIRCFENVKLAARLEA